MSSELDGLSDDFPEDFFKMKVLPELLKSVEFGGGGPKVFTVIMKIASKLSDDEFESRLVPVIIRLFNIPDRAMRVCLLDNLPLMIDRIPQKDVNGKIFPMMVTGFTDLAPVVREQTVKAVLTVISKLSDRTINGELLRYLAKTASDEQPGIRTNTTICLGKIARNLGTSSRSKVLIAAFSRSLRDPFVHARNAALQALNATIDVFSDDDCAIKILPALCLSLVDKEKIVRDQANKTLDNYLQRVRKYASTLPDTAIPPTENGIAAAAPAARMGNQNDTSWAGWAISSFTNKMAAARGEIQTAPVNGTTSQPGSLPASGRATPAVSVTAERPGPAPRTATTTHAAHSSILQQEDCEDGGDGLDAWGTMDNEDDSFFDAPSSAKRSPSPGPAVAFDDGGEPDFAGWLAAQSKAKARPPLPKGLSKTNTTTKSNLRPLAMERSISTSAIGSSNLVTKPKASVPAKKLDLKPKEPEPSADDWGDAWD
jgi:SCY1-like protein 1